MDAKMNRMYYRHELYDRIRSSEPVKRKSIFIEKVNANGFLERIEFFGSKHNIPKGYRPSQKKGFR